MPGAWEIRSKRQVLLYSLHVDLTTIAWAYGLRNLIVPGDVMGLSGMPYDHARNQACIRCLEGGYQWLFSLDSDVVAPRDTILKLMSRGFPIISGVYCRRSPPHGLPVAIKNGSWLNPLPPPQVMDVDLVGAGCLLIHRSVLERLPPQRPLEGKTWFDWRVDCQGIKNPDGSLRFHQGMCLSEDFTFCVHAKNHGIPVKLDTSIMCKHIGMAQATYGDLQPLDASPHT